MSRESDYTSLRLKRLKTGAIGFLAGICFGIPVTYLIDGVYFNLFTVMCGAVGLGAIIALFEKPAISPQLMMLKRRNSKQNSILLI